MMPEDLNDRFERTLETIALHFKRMEFAKSKVEPFIPVTRDNYYAMNDETIGFLDQYIYRFSKLQDIMGTRLFPITLEALAEPMNDKAFIDILNRLEKLGIIQSALDWVQLRKIRNDLAHEYPTSLLEQIEGINVLFEKMDEMKQIATNCKSFLKNYL